MSTLTLAEYARRVGKSRAAVTQWKQEGKLVMQGARVAVEASDAKLHTYRVGGMPAIVNPSPVVKRGRPAALDLNSTEPIELPVADIQLALDALDGKQQFDWSATGKRERARHAARCVGWVAAESALRDDGHWGGFQLRDPDWPELASENSIVDGFGYELQPWQVVQHCRELTAPHVWPDGSTMRDERVTIIPSLLHTLARPYTRCTCPSECANGSLG